MKSYPKQQGIIIEILVIIIALVALKFVFDVDIVGFLRSDFVADAFQYLGEIVEALWDNIKTLF